MFFNPKKVFPKEISQARKNGFGWPTFYVGPLYDMSDKEAKAFMDKFDEQTKLIKEVRSQEIKDGIRPENFSEDLIENAILESDYNEEVLKRFK